MTDHILLPSLIPPANHPNPLEWLIEQHDHVTDLYDMHGYEYLKYDGFDGCTWAGAEHKYFGEMLKAIAARLELKILHRDPQFDNRWASLQNPNDDNPLRLAP